MTQELSDRQVAKRSQILTAAHRLFLDQGFAGTSMDAVTAEAGVSKQTLYSYFPNKVDLLANVLHTSVGRLVIQPLASPPNSSEDLRATLLGFATVLTRNLLRPDSIAMVRLLLGEVFRVPELRRAFHQALPGQVLSQVETLLDQAARAGLISLQDSDLSSRMFVGPLMTYVALDGFLSADPSGPPSQLELERLVDAFLSTVKLDS